MQIAAARRLKVRCTQPVPARLQQTFDALRRRLLLFRAVDLLHSARVTVPKYGEGVVLTVKDQVLEVEKACSGLSMLLTFLALSTRCTHEGTRIDIVNNNTSFECPNHGARYDSNGSVTRQPQAAGSATSLPTYQTSYDSATDILTISSVFATT